MTDLTVAATQMACSWDLDQNLETAEGLIREAAEKGAQVIQVQELFRQFQHANTGRGPSHVKIITQFYSVCTSFLGLQSRFNGVNTDFNRNAV